MSTRPHEWMTPKRRFLSGLFGGRVDRVPVASATSVTTLESMEATGAFFPEVHLDAEKMARLAAADHDILGFDAIMPVFSGSQHGVALGCEVDWGTREDFPKKTSTPPINDPRDVDIPKDYLEHPATTAILDAIRLLKREYGDHVAIIGKTTGPWSLSFGMYGMERFLVDTVHDPAKVHAFIEAYVPATVSFARAQFQAGADAVMLGDLATGDLVGPEAYRDFLLPVHQRLTREIGGPIILHMCGDTLDRMDYVADSGIDCFHFADKVDPSKARTAVGNRMSLMGNINNVQTLLHGSPDDVKREAARAIKAGVNILAPECAIPVAVRQANLRAIVEASIEASFATV